MVLKPLEFRDCTFDDPEFRQSLQEHEKEIDRTSREIKQLVREISDVITATSTLSRCQKQLAKHLAEFNFDIIGGSQTDDEIVITNSLKEFGRVLSDIEDERTKILENSIGQFVNPLEEFRRDQIGGVKAEKKKFDKESTKFYQAQEKHLSLSCKKDENSLREADADLQMQRRHFIQASLRYVKSIQEVHERKKFEFVETLWSFMSAWMRFYRISYDITKEFEPYMRDLQVRVQKVRDSFNAFCAEGETLMNKIQKTSENPLNSVSQLTTGFMYLMEKKAFGTTWTKHYCAYDKTIKQLTLVAFSHAHGRVIGVPEVLRLKSCIRRSNETIDKRFCFDLITEEKGTVTFQAPSEEDRVRWMNAMDGKEPIYQQPGKSFKENEFMTDLNEAGFRFVTSCIEAIEKRGVNEQGLYRLAGVSSKANRLLQQALDSSERISLSDELAWETKSITSALKTYFRSLPEPLLTFRLHESLIKAAQKDNKQDRLNEVHSLVATLPDVNRRMLEILIRHLAKVASNSAKNLMTVSNLGVCFGPTLLRPEEESVAALVDIKFCNIIVEILIEHWQKIFLSLPSSTPPNEYAALITKLPATPKPVPANQLTTNFFPRSDLNINKTNNGSTGGSSVPSGKPFMDKVVAVPFQPWQPRVQSVQATRSSPPDTRSAKNSPSESISDIYYSMPLDQLDNHGHPLDKSMDFGSYAQPDTSSGRVAMAIARLSSPAYPGSAHLTAQFFPKHGPDGHTAPKTGENGTSASSNLSSLSSSRNTSPYPHGQTTRTSDRNSVPPSPLATNPPPKSIQNSGPQKMPNLGDSAFRTSQNRNFMIKNHPPSGRKVRTIYACQGDGDGELSFEPNEVITSVRQSHEPGWLYGELKGKIGLLPANYVEDFPQETGS